MWVLRIIDIVTQIVNLHKTYRKDLILNKLIRNKDIVQPKPSDITPAQVLLPDPTYSIRYLSDHV